MDQKEFETEAFKSCYGSHSLIIQFYWHAMKDMQASFEQNIPIYNDIAFVSIRNPKSTDHISYPVDESHIEKYPEEWADFQRRSQQQTIHLSALPKMRPAIRLALEELKIRDVATLLAAKLPEYLQPWQAWAKQIKAIHDDVDAPKEIAVSIEKQPVKAKRGRPRKSDAQHISNEPQPSPV